jgi:hypothetical protein
MARKDKEQKNKSSATRDEAKIKLVLEQYKLSDLFKNAAGVQIYNGNTKSINKITDIDESILLQPSNVLIIKTPRIVRDNEEILKIEFRDELNNYAYQVEYKNGSIIIRNLYAPQYLPTDTILTITKLVVQ